MDESISFFPPPISLSLSPVWFQHGIKALGNLQNVGLNPHNHLYPNILCKKI